MRIPTREEFAPLPEVVAALGTPDPLAVLAELENQLEAVEGSNEQLRKIANELREVAEELEAGIRGVHWLGPAYDAFRRRVDPILKWLWDAAEELDEKPEKVSKISEGTKDTIRRILENIVGVAVIVGAILSRLGLNRAVLVVALIGGLAALISANLNDFLLFIDARVESLHKRINEPLDKPWIM